MYKYKCLVCDSEFIRDWEDKKRAKPKYCSRICYGNERILLHKNLIGQRFGKLTVVAISENRSKFGQAALKCLCECGKEKDIGHHHLKIGVKSCGCWKSGKDRAFPTFLKKIEKTETCWIWKGQINKAGYGKHCGKYAHRLSYNYYIGEIPKGKMLCHKCNNKICVNPEHIYAGTAKDNALDAIAAGVYIKRNLISKRYKKE